MSASFNDNSKRRRDREGRDYTEFGFRELGSDDTIDRYLDREITRDSAAFRAAFVKRDFRKQLDETEAMLGELRRPIRTPDLTSAILEAVDSRKAFVATRTRRVVTLGRLAVAASVLLAVGGVVLIERTHPGLTTLGDSVEPLAGVVSAASMSKHEVALPGTVVREASPEENVRAGSVLMNWTMAKLGSVEAVEVRGCLASPAAGGVGSWASNVRTPVAVPDASSDWAVGFATFPTPDPQGRIWTARGW